MCFSSWDGLNCDRTSRQHPDVPHRTTPVYSMYRTAPVYPSIYRSAPVYPSIYRTAPVYSIYRTAPVYPSM